MNQKPIDDSLQHLSELHEIQVKDVQYWRAEMEKNEESQSLRRALCRSIFSLIEGTSYLLKKSALDVEDAKQIFTNADFALLNDEGYELDSRGYAKVIRKHLPTLANIRYSMEAFSKSNHSKYSPNCSGQGWQDIQLAYEIRNRLTHPKSTTDLNLTKKDMKTIEGAYKWFMVAYTMCFVETIKSLNK